MFWQTYQQDCGIDVWSAGVMLLSILSGRYPFFEASDDLLALAELVAIFGSAELERVATSLGKRLHVGVSTKKTELDELCKKYAT